MSRLLPLLNVLICFFCVHVVHVVHVGLHYTKCIERVLAGPISLGYLHFMGFCGASHSAYTLRLDRTNQHQESRSV